MVGKEKLKETVNKKRGQVLIFEFSGENCRGKPHPFMSGEDVTS